MQSNQNIQPKKEHTHKFKRHTYETGNKIFFCALPKCNKKLKVGLALGKESLCWRCGEVFVMNEYAIRLAKPHCENCHKSKNGDNFILPSNQTDMPDKIKETLKDGSWDATSTLPLSERLKKLTSTVVKEEEDEL